MKKSKKYIKQEKPKTVMVSARVPKAQLDLLHAKNINVSRVIQDAIAEATRWAKNIKARDEVIVDV